MCGPDWCLVVQCSAVVCVHAHLWGVPPEPVPGRVPPVRGGDGNQRYLLAPHRYGPYCLRTAWLPVAPAQNVSLPLHSCPLPTALAFLMHLRCLMPLPCPCAASMLFALSLCLSWPVLCHCSACCGFFLPVLPCPAWPCPALLCPALHCCVPALVLLFCTALHVMISIALLCSVPHTLLSCALSSYAPSPCAL